MVVRWKGVGGWVRKVREFRRPNWLSQNSHRDVKYNTGNPVNNIVITVCSARWELG